MIIGSPDNLPVADDDGRDPTDDTPPLDDTADHLHDEPPHPDA